MAVTTRTYEQLALEEPHEKWELYHGRVRKKPPMTMQHNYLGFELAYAIRSQVSHDDFHVRCDQGRLLTATSYLVPDVFVVPAAVAMKFRGLDSTLEAHAEAVPFVAEVWSRSTGDYDVTGKLAEYQQRGDAEIWLLQPYEKSVTAYRRQPSGEYLAEQLSQSKEGLVALPSVMIDLVALFRS